MHEELRDSDAGQRSERRIRHRRRPGHRAVRCGPRHGGQGAGGPRLVCRRQSAARADRADGRAGPGGRVAHHPARGGDGRAIAWLHRRSGLGAQRSGHPQHHAAGAVPGGLRRHPGAPLRAEPPQPSVAGQSDSGRRHCRRARDAGAGARRRRPGDRHVDAVGARAAGKHRTGLRRRDRRAHQRHGGVVRLQVRAADGRRHGDGRAVPAQPALGRRAAAAHRSAPRGARLRAGSAGRRGVPGHLPSTAGRRHRGISPGGKALHDRCHRLHRRQASQRRDGRGAGGTSAGR